MTKIKIATYNIHGWVDDNQKTNLDRVVELINQQDPDILCLQEVYKRTTPMYLKFISMTKFTYNIRWESCAILSKKMYRLTELGSEEGKGYSKQKELHNLLPPAPEFGFNRPRYVTAVVRSEDTNQPVFFLSCIHLIPKFTNLRLEEVLRISSDIRPLFDSQLPQLWMGDFNTLTKADYTDDEWNQIVRIRKENGRKLPSNDVVEGLESLGFKDNWTKAGRPEPRTTSRFNTRVDYIFSTEHFDKNWKLQSFLHLPHEASDHSFVMAEYQLVKVL